MKKNVTIGLFYGESFYDVSLISQEDKKLIFNERYYAPRSSLKNQITQIVNQNPEISINQVTIGTRFVEKIFGFKLGGTVAQIVTQGFEKWLPLHQKNHLENCFKIEIAPDLSADDMILSVNERINTKGEVETEINLKEIDSLIAKLKQIQAKRVCLHLLNSNKNKIHSDAIKAKLVENNFEVFDPNTLVGCEHAESDFPLWRLNLLEASTSGTFGELKDNIIEALAPFVAAEKIYFLNHQLKTHQGEVGNRISSLFAFENAFYSFFKKKNLIPEKSDIFHLGVENFSFYTSQSIPWLSPWGETCLETVGRKDFKIQPTNSFYLNSFEEIEITKSEESFEPGPMSLERGRIPCVYDILNSENLSKELHKKLKDSFWALVRSSKTQHSEANTFDEFRDVILERLLWELQFMSTQENLVLYGKWAEKNYQFIKKMLPNKNIILIKESEYPKSYILAASELN